MIVDELRKFLLWNAIGYSIWLTYLRVLYA